MSTSTSDPSCYTPTLGHGAPFPLVPMGPSRVERRPIRRVTRTMSATDLASANLIRLYYTGSGKSFSLPGFTYRLLVQTFFSYSFQMCPSHNLHLSPKAATHVTPFPDLTSPLSSVSTISCRLRLSLVLVLLFTFAVSANSAVHRLHQLREPIGLPA